MVLIKKETLQHDLSTASSTPITFLACNTFLNGALFVCGCLSSKQSIPMHCKAMLRHFRALGQLLKTRPIQQKLCLLESEMDDQHLDSFLALMTAGSVTATGSLL